MTRSLSILFVLLTSVSCAAERQAASDFRTLTQTAISGDQAAADQAIAELRRNGPAAVAFLADYAKQREAGAAAFPMDRLENVIDRVGGQRYCRYSRLYWTTDIEEAKRLAQASGKPILSLHMLGKLTDELSCANSRFFRTLLYADHDIADVMRKNYVLHWRTVRPVPKITIDFGDGRKIERTITGNSVHYLLASDGTPLDALPGLYSPAAFLQVLFEWQAFHSAYAAQPDQREMLLRRWHTHQLAALINRWNNDLLAIKAAESVRNQAAPSQQGAPTAAAATNITFTKKRTELPVLAAMQPLLPRLEHETDAAMWAKIAALHAAQSELSQESKALIARQNPTLKGTPSANEDEEEDENGTVSFGLDAQGPTILDLDVSFTKNQFESPLFTLIRNLEETVAQDTVRNEYVMHRAIHEWFLDEHYEGTADLTVFNDRVYTDLFLMPSTDPWLGLLQPDIYSGIHNAGVKENAANASR